MDSYDVIKIALIGAAGTGKSSLGRALAGQRFERNYTSTIGADMICTYNHTDKLKIIMWDLAGIERFTFIIRSYLESCDVVCFCYDSNNHESYKELIILHNKLFNSFGTKPKCIVATKSDLNTVFTKHMYGKNLASQMNCPFILTSALNNDVQGLMEWVVNSRRTNVIEFNVEEEEETRDCCRCIVQ